MRMVAGYATLVIVLICMVQIWRIGRAAKQRQQRSEEWYKRHAPAFLQPSDERL